MSPEKGSRLDKTVSFSIEETKETHEVALKLVSQGRWSFFHDLTILRWDTKNIQKNIRFMFLIFYIFPTDISPTQ